MSKFVAWWGNPPPDPPPRPRRNMTPARAANDFETATEIAAYAQLNRGVLSETELKVLLDEIIRRRDRDEPDAQDALEKLALIL